MHWGQDPPFNVSRKERPRLMSFVGSITHGDVEVRRRIAQQCVALRSLCTWILIGFGGLTKRPLPLHKTKRNEFSTFGVGAPSCAGRHACDGAPSRSKLAAPAQAHLLTAL